MKILNLTYSFAADRYDAWRFAQIFSCSRRVVVLGFVAYGVVRFVAYDRISEDTDTISEERSASQWDEMEMETARTMSR